MIPERKKKVIVLALAIGAVSIQIFFLLTDRLFYILPDSLWLPGIGLGWVYLVALGLATAAIGKTISWKPGGKKLRVFVILTSVISIIYSCFCLMGIYFISHLNP